MGSLMLSLLLVTALCVFSDANGLSKREGDGHDTVTINTSSQKRLRYTYTLVSNDMINNKTSIEFSVKACKCAYIALMGETDEKGKLYEIIIGGNKNSESRILLKRYGIKKASFEGTVLDCEQFKKFKVTWEDGIIQVFKYENDIPIKFLEYQDESPMDVQSVGFATRRAEGVWKIAVKDD